MHSIKSKAGKNECRMDFFVSGRFTVKLHSPSEFCITWFNYAVVTRINGNIE